MSDAVVVTDVMEGADVLVREGGDRAGFAQQPFTPFRVCRQRSWEHFDGDTASETRITSAIHLAHSARTQRGLHLGRAERLVRKAFARKPRRLKAA